MEEDYKDEIADRYEKLISSFVWTPMNTEKIKDLLLKINKKMNELYDKVQLLKQDFDSGAEKGMELYKEYVIDACLICSPRENSWDLDSETQEKISTRISHIQRNIYATQEKIEDRGNQLLFSTGIFNSPDLADIPACNYAQVLFDLSKTYSPQDMLDMNIEDFKFHIEVFFDPDC